MSESHRPPDPAAEAAAPPEGHERLRTPRAWAGSLTRDPAASPPAAAPGAEDAVAGGVSPMRQPGGSFRERVRARATGVDLLLFRVGAELFATDLAAVEEAVELTAVRPLPEMPASMLGVFDLRGRMTPVYSPERALGVRLTTAAGIALLMRAGGRRVALAVDDVEDVMRPDLSALRGIAIVGTGEDMLLGLLHRGVELVAIADPAVLIAACLTDRVLETA